MAGALTRTHALSHCTFRGSSHVHAYCFHTHDESWEVLPHHPWLSDGWSDPAYHGTIQLLAVGETLFVVARGSAELHIGSYNTESRVWNSGLPGYRVLGDAAGWHGEACYSTMRSCVVGNTLYVLGR